MKKLLLLSIIIASLVACQSDKKKELENLINKRNKLNDEIAMLQKELNVSADSVKTLKVNFDTVKVATFKHYIEVQGKVDGDKNVVVSSQMGGVITSISVVEGQNVEKGQLLATTDGSILVQSIQEVKGQLEFATNLYLKQKTLWDQKIGSEVQYLSAKNNKESLEKRLSTLNEQFEQTRIKSPISGSVEEIPVKVGQMLAPGFPAMKIINMSKVKVVSDVAESYSSKIKKNDPVVIFFPDMNSEIASTINFASKLINNVNRTFQVEVKLDNSTGIEYRANMIAVLKIADYINEKAISIPVNLIQRSKDSEYVMVAVKKNNQWVATRKIITKGISYNGLIEITSGLTEGDLIITAGYVDLLDGQELSF